MAKPPPPPPPTAAAPVYAGPQRQFRRLVVRMSAEIRTARTVFTATTHDLSEGGAGVLSDRALAEGEEIALGLFLVIDDVEEHLPPLWVKGQVVWASELDSGKHMAGVRFSAISPEQKSWLGKVLAQLGEAPKAAGGSGPAAAR